MLGSDQLAHAQPLLSQQDTTSESAEVAVPLWETATLRLNYISTTWAKVLNDLAEKTGSTLVMYDIPPGRYNRQDWDQHSRTEAVRILNRELEPLGFRVLEKGEFLTVIEMRRARTQYRRPVTPDDRPAGPTTDDRPVAARYERRFDSITDSIRSQQRIATTPRTMDGRIRTVGHEEPADTESAPQPAPVSEAPQPQSNLVVSVEKQPAAEVARRIYKTFQSRARLVDAGPNGLPAFEVAPLKSEEGSTDVWFTVEIDTTRNELTIAAPKPVANALASLVRRLDTPPQEGQPEPQLVAGDGNMAQVGKRLRPVLQQMQQEGAAEGTGTVPARNVNATTDARDNALAAPPQPNRPGQWIAQADPDNQPMQGPQPAPVPPGDAPPVPPNGQMPPQQQPPGGLQGLLGNLKGDVTIEALEDLDLLILRGNQADVDAVMEVIRSIEQLAVGSTPEIHLLRLQFVNSESLAVLLNDVYERIGGLQGPAASAVQRSQNVNVVPVVKPNAVLILAPGNLMESVLTLAQELDQPIDPRAEFEVFRLKHAIASQVVELIEEFYEERPGLGTRLSAVADIRTNSVVVQGRPADLEELALLIRRIDRDEARAVNQLRIIPLRSALATELAEFLSTTIQNVLNPPQVAGQVGGFGGAGQGPQELRDSKAVVLEFLTRDGTAEKLIRSGLLSDIRINADVRSNSLMITAPEQSLPLLEELVHLLDQPSPVVAEIRVFSLENADATAAAELLEALFTQDQQQQQDGGGQLGIQIAGADDVSSSLVPLRFSVDARTNSVVAIGGADALTVVEAILLRLDQSDLRNRQTTVLKLRNSPAADVADAINQFLQSQRDLIQLDPDRISTVEILEQEVIVTPEPVTNSLLISATPRYFDEIQRLAQELDREPASVVIQALLVEVELNDTDEFGVELGFQDSVLFDRSVIDNLLTISETNTSPNGVQTTTQRIISQEGTPGFLFNNQPLGNNTSVRPDVVGGQSLSNFALGRVNGDLGFGGLVLSASSDSVNILIRALASRRNVHILSRPQIIALDNQLAQIQVGQRVPIVDGVNISTQGTANPNVVQDEAGIILTVTPRISPEGQVVMEVVAEKSQFTGEGVPIFVDGLTGNVIESPIKDITTARTTVKVPDGQTIVVGGMITKLDDTIKRKVPWLGDIPLVGHLFRFDSHNEQRTELLIFLTPRIVHGDADSELIKQVEAERLHWFEFEAEQMHGPLFSVPLETPPPVFEGMPPMMAPPGTIEAVPPMEGGDIPTTRVPAGSLNLSQPPSFQRSEDPAVIRIQEGELPTEPSKLPPGLPPGPPSTPPNAPPSGPAMP
ncbi:secretin N-terminal domain-containing protein [Maioricimonas rarisocia]|nr:secretin N-terminal domain-containing protein [Maioricimonas rarisocia]